MGQTRRISDAPLQLGCIGEEQMPYFASLLLPDAVAAIERGEPVTAIGIAHEEVACGALAGYVEDGCFRVISLYVAPDYRRLGGARLMIDQLEELLTEEPDIWSMEISFTTAEPDNETMIPFLSSMGYSPANDMGRNIYTFTLGQLENAKPLARPASRSLRIRSFSQLSEDMLRAAQKRGIAMGTPLPENMLTGPQVERELSYALVKDGKIEAYAAVDHSCCGVLTLCGLWVGEKNPMILYSLLKMVISRTLELYPPDTCVALQVTNEQSLRLIHGLVPDAKKISFTYRHILQLNGR